MSRQLTVKDIAKAVEQMRKNGMTDTEIADTPIYIGNDDELNGIHTAWYVNIIDPNNKDDEDLVEMINEDYHNIPLKDKAILIS